MNLDLIGFTQEIIYLKQRNLPKIEDSAYVINRDKCKSIGTHSIALFVNGDNKSAFYDAIYFDSFGVKHIPNKIHVFMGKKNFITNTYGIQTCNSIRCRYFCITFLISF